MIEVKNLTKRFAHVTAVDNISFEIKKGEVVGFLGPNAAGKTTTMRILTCYMLPDNGSATVAGYDIYENSFEIKKRVGYLPENNPLYNDMEVLGYLKFLAEIRQIPSQIRQKRINNIIEMCNIESVIKKNIGELSRGYRQRVGLAQAMIHDPEILILDEPTSGLDPRQITGVRELIKKLGEEKTVILSTHILSEVSATCSRALIINEGKIVASGSLKELQDRAKAKNLIFATIRGHEAEVTSKLSELDKIESFEVIERKEGNLNRYEIRSKNGLDITEEIFFIARDNNWSLTELKKETVTLEDVFLQLTKEEGQ